MKREEPIQPLSGVQDWHIKGREAAHAAHPLFSRHRWEKHISLKTFQCLRAGITWNTKKFCEKSWLQNAMEVSVRPQGGCLNPWFPKPSSETWVLHCSLLLHQTPWCSGSRGEVKVSRLKRPVWRDSLSWKPPSNLRARQLECLMLLHGFWNMLRRCGSQETRFSFPWKMLKTVVSFWVKCGDLALANKKKNHMEWEF